MSVNSTRKATKIIGQRKAFIGREFQSLAKQGKKLLTDIPVKSRNGEKKIMQSIRIMNRPPSRIRKWNQLS